MPEGNAYRWMPRGITACILVVTMSLCIAFTGIGCRKQEVQKTLEELRITMEEPVISWDLPHVHMSIDWRILEMVASRLVRFDFESQTLELDLARRYEVSPDGLTYTFWLREGVKWHHGYGELTGEDVKFTFERHLDPEVASHGRENLGTLKEVIVDPADPYKVTFVHSAPSAMFLSVLGWQQGFVQCKKFITETLAAGGDIDGFIVGTGPYYLAEHKRGSHVLLKRFEEYYGVRPIADSIRLITVMDEFVGVQAVVSGQCHIAPLRSVDVITQCKLNPNEKAVLIPQTSLQSMIFHMNVERPPMNDLRVRQALAYLLDLDELSKGLYGAVDMYPTFLPRGVLGATDEYWTYEYDPAKAMKLLADAGYPDGLDLPLYAREGWHAVVAEVAGDLWRDAGVYVVVMDEALRAQLRKTRQFELMFGALTRVDPGEFAVEFRSGATINYGQYSDPKLDQLIDQAAETLDVESRGLLYKQIQKIVAENVYGIYPGTNCTYCLMDSSLEGLVTLPFPGVMNIEKVRYR